MKYLVGLGALVLLVIGGFWYTNNTENGYHMDFDGAMSGMMQGGGKES